MTTALASLSAGLVHYRRVQAEALGRVASFRRDGWQRTLSCSWFSSGRIRASSRDNEVPSPMELWPGVSSPPDLEFDCQKFHKEALKVDDIESLMGFREVGDYALQPYMGSVDMPEEEELPTEYVPPPPIPVEDMEMRDRVEEVMYTLLKCTPGPMMTLLHDQEKWESLVKIFSQTVEIQDPLICLKGIHSFKTLLKVLCHSGISLDLNEVYYENISADRFKRWVYVVWTVTLTNNLEDSLEKSGLTEWWETAYCSLLDHFGKPQDESELADKTQNDEDKARYPRRSAQDRILKLSGESKFEVNKEGEVTSVSSRWYKLTEDDDIELDTSKLWLAGLYSRNI